MIRFLAPWAAAGLLLLAAPVLIHMLLRRHARRVVFPATHFLVATRAAAVRLRRPSDLALLLVRLGIVAAAIAAAMQPVVITAGRVARWDTRVIRAVIVDRSAAAGAQSDLASLAAQQTQAFRAQQFESGDVRGALSRAAAWLAAAPPGRREAVILSDFQRGTLDREDLAVLPVGTGIATIRVGTLPQSRDVRLDPVDGFRGARWQPSLRVDAASTAVTWSRVAEGSRPAWLTTSQPSDQDAAAARAVYAAMSAGVAAGDDSRRVRVRFAGAPQPPQGSSAMRTPWIVDAALSLRDSALLRQTSATIHASEQAGALIVDTSVAATSVDAAAVVRAVVLAVRPAAIANREAEVVSVADAELAQWRREAAPVRAVPGGAYSFDAADSDARWLWAIALALLGLESWLRRRQPESRTEEVRDAA